MKTLEIICEKAVLPTILAAPFMVPASLLFWWLDNHTSVSHAVLAPMLVAQILGGMVLGSYLSKKLLA
jgi:hypothetical protein